MTAAKASMDAMLISRADRERVTSRLMALVREALEEDGPLDATEREVAASIVARRPRLDALSNEEVDFVLDVIRSKWSFSDADASLAIDLITTGGADKSA